MSIVANIRTINNSGKNISLPITATGYPRRIGYNRSVKKVLKNVTQTQTRRTSLISQLTRAILKISIILGTRMIPF